MIAQDTHPIRLCCTSNSKQPTAARQLPPFYPTGGSPPVLQPAAAANFPFALANLDQLAQFAKNARAPRSQNVKGPKKIIAISGEFPKEAQPKNQLRRRQRANQIIERNGMQSSE
jgi:hypothetical protein